MQNSHAIHIETSLNKWPAHYLFHNNNAIPHFPCLHASSCSHKQQRDFEILFTVLLGTVQDVTPFSVVKVYRRLGVTYYLYLHLLFQYLFSQSTFLFEDRKSTFLRNVGTLISIYDHRCLAILVVQLAACQICDLMRAQLRVPGSSSVVENSAAPA